MIRSVAILGSGFGLYGYVPAIAGVCRCDVVLPVRYGELLNARPELARFKHRIRWADDEHTALDSVDAVVLALRPVDQVLRLSECLARPNVEAIILEKPVCRTPSEAALQYSDLVKSKRRVRVGYTFVEAPWATRLRRYLTAPTRFARIRIEWRFMAHHFSADIRNWKRRTNEGGGALRFYGIQILALLASLGYDGAQKSGVWGREPNEIEGWEATVVAASLPDCEVVVDSRSFETSFRISYQDQERNVRSFQELLQEPFAEFAPPPDWPDVDRRVPCLAQIFSSLVEEDAALSPFHLATINLWRSVERISLYEDRQYAPCRP